MATNNCYVTVTTEIDYHQALKALELLIAQREPIRFSVWDVQRLEGLVTAVKEKLHEREIIDAATRDSMVSSKSVCAVISRCIE